MAFPKFRMYIDGIYTRLTVDWLLQGHCISSLTKSLQLELDG